MEHAFLPAARWLERRIDALVVAPLAAGLRAALPAGADSRLAALAAAFERTYGAAARHPNAVDLPLLNPLHTLVLIAAYFVAVAAGVAVMHARPRFELKWPAAAYNAFCVLLSAYMCLATLAEVARTYDAYWLPDIVVGPAGGKMAKLMWLFYFSKVIEFSDTMIMVLKKNNRQISFLHLYHHSSIFLFWVHVVAFNPGGCAFLSCVLNSFIHTLMYGYYLCAALKISLAPIKKYMTLMQMAQFCVLFAQSASAVVQGYREPAGCDCHFGMSVGLLVYMVTMLALFGNFFVQDRKRERARRLSAASSESRRGEVKLSAKVRDVSESPRSTLRAADRED